VTDYQAFLELEPVWNRLVDQAGLEYPFIRHEWVRAFWDCFEHGGRLYILLVMDQGRPIGIAPLMLDQATMYGISVSRLRAPTNVYSERFDFILPIKAWECSRAIWTYLALHGQEWDVVELRQLPAGCRILETLPRTELEERLLFGQWTSTDAPYVAVTRDWDAYLDSLKKRHRVNVRRCQRHLETLGPVGLDVVVSNDRLDRDLEEALDLEAVTWKDEGGTAIRCRPDSRAFYRRILRQAGERGWLRMYFLTIGAKRIAVRIALLFRNRIYMLKSGYDPRYAAYAPGHVLSHKILEEAWRLKFEEVDFLGSCERWKQAWSTGLRRHFWLFVFPRRPKPRLLHYLKVSVAPRIKESRVRAVASKVQEEIRSVGQHPPVSRLKRGLVRHGLAGCAVLAARSAVQSLGQALYRHERHLWYAAEPEEVRGACALSDGMELQRGGREHLDLLSWSNLYGWSAAESFLAEGGELWIVCEAERAVSCCWIFRGRVPTVAARGGWTDLPPKTVCMEGVMTEANYRGRGIAPAAWSLIARRLRAEGVRTIATKVEERNGSMRRALAKAGFHEVATMDYLFVGGLSRVRVVPAREILERHLEMLREVQKLAA